MAKFKVGDKIKPLEDEDLGYHSYILPSEVYTATRVHSLWSDLIDIAGLASAQAIETSATRWDKSWSEDWFELYEEKETEMTAEQIRNEIIRIDSHIEEANKDIEKAQEERNSLVEKLREKWFELSNNSVQVVIKDKNYHSVGDTVTIIASRHGHAFYIGEKVKILSYDGYGEYDCTNGEESWFVRDDEIAGLS